MRRALAILVAVALALPARADGPPSPPQDDAWTVLEPGAAWTAPADGGALCLDSRAWSFTLETRRYLEARSRAAEEVAEGQFLRGIMWGVAAGAVAGAAAALVAR